MTQAAAIAAALDRIDRKLTDLIVYALTCRPENREVRPAHPENLAEKGGRSTT